MNIVIHLSMGFGRQATSPAAKRHDCKEVQFYLWFILPSLQMHIFTDTREKLEKMRCSFQFLHHIMTRRIITSPGWVLWLPQVNHPPMHFNMVPIIFFLCSFIIVMDEVSSPRKRECGFGGKMNPYF